MDLHLHMDTEWFTNVLSILNKTSNHQIELKREIIKLSKEKVYFDNVLKGGNLYSEQDLPFRFLNKVPEYTENWKYEDISGPLNKKFLDVLIPKRPSIDIASWGTVNDDPGGIFTMYIKNTLENGNAEPFFLPDPIAEVVQVLFNQQIHATTFMKIKRFLVYFFFYYNMAFSIRILFNWYIIFNPYQLPIDLFRMLVDPVMNALEGILPAVIGIDLGTSIIMAIFGYLLDIIRRLVLTIPYLPSEGHFIECELEDIIYHDEFGNKVTEIYNYTGLDEFIKNKAARSAVANVDGIALYIFQGFPTLWKKYSIPNSVREYWYYHRPDILERLKEEFKDDPELYNRLEPNHVLKGISKTISSLPLDDTLHLNSLDLENVSTSLSHFKSHPLIIDSFHFHFHL